jgi:2-oxoglutarate dehydrogenase complex dihydrolipoamide succinyltransferase (E2) component
MSVKVVVPQIGQSIAEATIVKWFKKPGDSIEKGEILVEIGTDKINTEIPAPESGVVARLLVQEGETVPVQTEIAVISSSAGESPAPRGPAPEASAPQRSTPQAPAQEAAQRHSPVVRRLAQEHNIDLSQISGTGEGGRITKEDLEKVIQKQSAEEKSPADEVVPMSRMRKLIAGHMVNSKRSTAELTTFFEIDMTEVVREREKAKEIYKRDYGFNLTYLPFVIVAAAKALRQFPVVNSSIDGENIRYKKNCNIGLAMAVEEGLLVPVVKNVDEKNVAGIARAAAELAKRARTRRLTAEDMSDGTFTITNPGVFGALMGTPIINYPQVAILGVGAIEKRAVVIQDAIVIRSMAYFSLTYDHRAMDGAIADSFLAHIKKTLETKCPPALD